MHSFYLPQISVFGSKIDLKDKKSVHHIKDVLRLKPGQELILFDVKSLRYRCVIDAFFSDGIKLSVKETSAPAENKDKISITVACAIPKQTRMDDIVDKLTQLGVKMIIPLKAERCIVRLEKGKESERLKRWRRIAQAASEQANRLDLPAIEKIKSLKEVLALASDYQVKLIPTLAPNTIPLIAALTKAKGGKALVLIGPEGDFSDEEIRLALESGCVPVSLGDTTLRVDTAAIAASAFLKLYADG